MKKILTALLAGAMLASTFCLGASATDINEDEHDRLSNYLKAFDSMILGRPGVFIGNYDSVVEKAKRVANNSGSTADACIKARRDVLSAVKSMDVYVSYARRTYEQAKTEQNYNNWYTDEDWLEFQNCVESLGNAVEKHSGDFTSGEVTTAYEKLLYTYNKMTNAYTVKGDIDKDGTFNINDVTVLQRYISEELELTGAQKMLTNAYYYEVPTIKDVTTLQRIAVNLEQFDNNCVFIAEKPDAACWDSELQYKTYCNYIICPRDTRPLMTNQFSDFDKVIYYYKCFPEELG